MRKPTNILFYFGITLSLLTGCSQENSVVPPLSREENVGICLNASVSTIEATITRSGIITGTTLEKRAPVGVFGLTGQGGNFIKPYLKNLEYLNVRPSGALTIADGLTVNYPPGQDKLYLYAYYPYITDVSTDGNRNASIPVSGTKGSETVTDYLYAGMITGSKALTAAGNKVSLPLKHALAILHFNTYTNMQEYTVDPHPILNSISFTAHEGQEGIMDLATRVITFNNSSNRTAVFLDYQAENLGIIANKAPIVKDYLLFPYEAAENSAIRKLTLNVSMPEEMKDKEIVVFDEADKDENQNKVIVRLKAGYITTINIKYTQSMATKADVSEW